MKKYLVRAIGALCILGAVALMLLPGWLELDGVRTRDLRSIREDVLGIVDMLADDFNRNLSSQDFKDDLKDNDLPYTRSTVKDQFKELSDLSKELLDQTVSLKELLVVCAKAPGVIKDLGGVLEISYADDMFEMIAEYALVRGNEPMEGVTSEDIRVAGESLQDQTEDIIDGAAGISWILYGLVGLLGLILLLGAASAVTHVCNKVRWLKYLFLAVLAAMAAGSVVALPVVNGILADALYGTPKLEALSLKLNAAPFLAVAMMFVPIVLDIIFERKNKQIKMEA